MSGPPDNPPQLRRAMGLLDVVLFFVIAGSNLQWVAGAAAAGPSSLSVWVIGGAVMFVPIAIVVVYLASHHPDEGGMYVWSKIAFGEGAGFITGWTYWMSNVPYFPALLYFAAGNALFAGGHAAGTAGAPPWYFIAVALGGMTLATVANVYGLGVGKWLNNVGAVSRWAVTLLIVTLGIVALVKFGSATHIDAATVRPGLALKDIIFWSFIAFAWTGPEALSFMAGEVKNPRRNIPYGLAIAAPAIAIIYVAGTASLLFTLAPNAIDGSTGVMQSIDSVVGRLGWQIVTPVAAILVLISCLGSTGAWLGAVARIPFVAGIDRYLPAAFGKVHPRWGSPVAALLTQAFFAGVVIVLGQSGTSAKGAYDVLVSSTVLITMVPFLLLFASAVKLRGEVTPDGGIRIPGGRATVVAAACVGAATTLCAMVLAVMPADSEPNKPLAVAKILGLNALMIGSGALVYWMRSRSSDHKAAARTT